MAEGTETRPTRSRELRTKVITVPGNLRQACEEFNSGRYFECHESLEEIWQEEEGEVRDLYKGLIQLAAAFVHITRGNYTGANRLLTTGLGYLTPYRGEGAMGFDVERICREAAEVHIQLQAHGPADVQLPRRPPRYEFDESALAAEALRWRAWGFDRNGESLPMTIQVAE